MTTPQEPPPPERVLLAAGTATYQHGADFTGGGLSNLNAVPQALETVVGALTRMKYHLATGPKARFLLNPEVEDLKDAIEAAASEAPLVVVYYTGHGLKPERGPFYLLTADSKENRLHRTALKAEEILALVNRPDQGLADAEQPQVLIILDCCYSGAGGIETLKTSLGGVGNPNVWVLASAGSKEWAQQGRFAQALANVLDKPNIGYPEKFIPLDLITEQVNTALARDVPDQRAHLFHAATIGVPPFFPNREHVPGVAGLTVEEQVCVSRLRAAPPEETATTGGFYVTGFTGRVHAVEEIAAWMRGQNDHGLAAVTGSPGSGKSTLLALPALLADGRNLDALLATPQPGSLLARAAGLFAGLPVGGVYARGLNPDDVARTIAIYLRREVTSHDDLMIDLEENPETTPHILVIDAVDEAINPPELITKLILPLAHHPKMKVLIGTRRHLLRPPSFTDASAPGLIIDLDTDSYRDPQALTEYVHQLLLAAHEPEVRTPYADDDLTATVAHAIAARATAPSITGHEESFLLAQLLARAVRGRGHVPDVTTPGWTDQLPSNVGAAFDEDLSRLDKHETTVRALLTALAWARGPGLPWENIWVPVAQALTRNDGTKDRRLGTSDVRWLLQNVGQYVVGDLGPGQRSAFRPFHDLLATHLRNEPARERLMDEPSSAADWHERSQQIEAAITEALLGTVPPGAEGHRDWELAHPYLRTYLAQHAHAAGPNSFAKLISDLDYLAVADPETLTPLLTPTDPALRSTARAYRRARPLLGQNANDNAAYLQEALVAETGHAPAVQGIGPTYRTLMASNRRDDSLLTLTGHTGWVSSVAFATSPDARLLLASVDGGDGTIRIWDPVSGSPVGEPISGRILDYHYPPGLEATLAFGTTHDGRLLLASALPWDDAVRVWDPLTGNPMMELFIGQTSLALPVAFGTAPSGSLILATGDSEGMLRLWDPLTGEPLRAPLNSDTESVSSVAFGTTDDGRLLLASGGSDGTVRLWDALTADPVGRPLNAHPDAVTKVAFFSAPGGPLLLASVGWDGTAVVWDVATGLPTRKTYPEHLGEVESVAFGSGPNSLLFLATAGVDGAVRLWNTATGAQVGATLTGHSGRVKCVAFGTTPDNHLLLASAGGDGTVRLWDPTAKATEREPVNGMTHSVSSLACGTGSDGNLILAFVGSDDRVRLWDASGDSFERKPHFGQGPVAFGKKPDGTLLLATGHTDNSVHVWDPSTGEMAGQPLTDFSSPAACAAFGTLPDGRLLLATGHSDDTVRVWDPFTGKQITKLLSGHEGDTIYTAVAAPPVSVAFGIVHDHGLLLATAGGDGDDGAVRLWDPLTGALVHEPLFGHSDHVESVAFGSTPDGRLLLASASRDAAVRLWDPITGTLVGGPLIGHTDSVVWVAFGTTPEGRPLLASASRDATVRLWDPVAGTALKTLRRRTHVKAVALHDTTLAIADDEGEVILKIRLIAP